jgi:putative transposase
MSYMHLTAGAFLDMHGNRLRFERRQDHQTEWRSTTSLEHFLFTDAEIQRGIAKGDIKLHGCGLPKDVKVSVIHGQRRPTQEDEIEADRKLHYVLAIHRRGLLRPDATQDQWRAVIDEIWEDVGRTWKRLRGARKGDVNKKPCLKSVQRWVAAGGKHPTRKKLISRHRHKGNYTDRITITVRRVINDSIFANYLTRPPITIYQLKDLIHGGVVEHNKSLPPGAKREQPPGLTAIETSIAALPQDEVLRARFGEMRAFIKYGSAEAQPNPKAPLDLVEIDSTPADLIVIDFKTGLPIGRPHIVLIIDKCTGMVLGWFVTFEFPSILALTQCLRNAMLEKTYIAEMNEKHQWDILHPCETFGVPNALGLDRARENISEHLARMAVKAGINQVMIFGGKKPWLKGLIERTIRTMSERLLHPAPGTTFHNTLKRLGYDAEKDAVCTMEDLEWALTKYFVDIYPREPSRSRNNRRRVDLWREGTRKHPVISVEDVADVDHLFGRSERAKVGRYGINNLSMQYFSKELTGYLPDRAFQKALVKDGGKVEFFLDPADLGVIYVHLPHVEKTIRVPVAAKWREYATGLSMWHHKAIRAYALAQARDANDADELLRCKIELMEIIRGAAARKTGALRARKIEKRMEGNSRLARSGSRATTSVSQPVPPVAAPDPLPQPSNDAPADGAASLPFVPSQRPRTGYRP